MVSFNVFRSTASGAYVEGVCLATDEKPVVGIANGSILYAVDASDGSTTRFMYDQNSMSWIEAGCPCSGGGSGGGDSGSGGPLLVTEIEIETGGVRLDKTWREIYDAVVAGRQVYLAFKTEEDPVHPSEFFDLNILQFITPIWGEDSPGWPSPYVVSFSGTDDDNRLYIYGNSLADDYPKHGTNT